MREANAQSERRVRTLLVFVALMHPEFEFEFLSDVGSDDEGSCASLLLHHTGGAASFSSSIL